MKQFLSLLVFFSLMFSSCRDDVTITDTIPQNNNQEVFFEGDVVGLVVNSAGEMIPDVDVSIEGKHTTTDENGVFRLSKLAGSDNGSLIKFKQDGYFDGFKFVYTANNQDAYVQVTLVEKKESFNFQSSTGGESSLNGGAKIGIPENAIVMSNGDAYSGEVVVFAHWYSPEETITLESMPGDLRAINEAGVLGQLATFGMMAVELETPSGSKLQLGNDQSAKLTFPLSNEMASNAPDEIPMWHMNEESGIWEEEGKAKLVDNSYEGEVSHFSFWNCDAWFPLVNIEGVLTDESGVPIPNYHVSILWDGTYYGGYGLTNSAGVFKGKVPKDAPLTMYVWHCGILLIEEDLGFLSNDKDLGTFSVTLTDFAKQISGRLLDCFNSPLVDGYAIVRNGYRPELIIPDNDGNFSAVVAGCGLPEIIFTGHDPATLNTTEEFLVSVDNADQDLGDIVVCEVLEDFLTFTINDGIVNQIKNIETYLVNDEIVHIMGYDDATKTRFDIQVELNEIGSTETSLVNILGFDDLNNSVYVGCSNFRNDCSLNVDFTSDPEMGMPLTGKSYGLISQDSISPEGTQGSEYDIDASFRVNVDRVFNTGSIEGQAWVDENQNGIRESGELPLANANIYARRVDMMSVQLYGDGTSYVKTDDDGKYSLNGLVPDVDYYLVFQQGLHYMPVEANQGGDDTVDSDFSFVTNQGYSTQIISFGEGETVSNIDLGVSVPLVSVSAYSINCTPDVEIICSINGGVAPFTIELSNGEVNSNGNNTFSNLSFGAYSLTVTDVFGSTSAYNIDVPEFRHSISGRAWIESTDGTPNVWDNFDEKLKNVTVELVDELGAVIRTTTTDQNANYSFYDFPPGKYQVRPVISAGFTFVDQSVGDLWQQSNIDPNTGLSDIIEVIDCQSYNSVNFGVK